MYSKNIISRQYVGTGNFIINKTSSHSLEACLGTCVGVALWDRKTGIGGLLHVLLPEPVASTGESILEETFYASCGLPFFIDELCRHGAQVSSMEAAIAGGALIGPISRNDLALNIGGRTSDKVMQVLQEWSIPIVFSETGGYCGRNFMLHMKDFSTEVQTIAEGHNNTSHTAVHRLSEADIQEAITGVHPIPQIALKIIEMTHQKNYNAPDIAREVMNEQVISARVISIVNSAMIGVKTRIESIERALVILGEKQLLRIILSAAIEPFFPETKRGYSLCMGGIFHHSLKTAIVSEILAQKTLKADPDVAYTAGLLHDIGKVVMDQYLEDAYSMFHDKIFTDNIELISAEKEILGYTHTEAGRKLAQRWKLPESLIETIALHHEPCRDSKHQELTCIIYLADIIMSFFQAGLDLDSLNIDYAGECLEKLGMKTEDMPFLVDSLPKDIFSQSKLF